MVASAVADTSVSEKTNGVTAPVAAETVLRKPGDLTGQGKLFLGGRPVPPAMGMQEYTQAGTLLRRTHKYFSKMPLPTRRWMAECILAECALEEDKIAAEEQALLNQAL